MASRVRHGAWLRASVIVVLSSCIQPPPVEVPLHRKGDTREIGRSAEGRPIHARFLGYGAETVLLLATIHGNEAAGTPILDRLGDELATHPEHLGDRRVVIVPVANPDGLARNMRHNARGVDLNRNFPADNREDSRRTGTALSEPEARALLRLVDQIRPVRAVSIHQPLSCVDYDGPAGPLAAAMSRSCGLRVKKLGGRPGSLGSWLGMDRGVPTVTLELPRDASGYTSEALWRRYGPALLTAIRGG